MAYQKINFLDQNVEKPRTYELQDNGDGTTTLIDSFGVITEIGTPINAENMNHIEDGIVDCENSINTKVLDVLKTIYPVGSIYLTTASSCPLSSLFGDWQLVSSGKALWTGDGSNGDTTIPAGLPNITGSINRSSMNSTTATTSGAFASTNVGVLGTFNAGGAMYRQDVSLNASRSSSIYGQSSTVQPPAYVVNAFRRVS